MHSRTLEITGRGRVRVAFGRRRRKKQEKKEEKVLIIVVLWNCCVMDQNKI